LPLDPPRCYNAAIHMDNSETKQNARDLFEAAWDDFMAEPVIELSVLKYLHRRCSKAFDLDPSLANNLPGVRGLMGALNLGLGVCAAEEGLKEESKAYYEEAIKLLEQSDNLSWYGYWCLGKALKEVREFEKSRHAFSMAVEHAVPGNGRLEPSNDLLARLWDEFAGVYTELEKPNDAADCYERAILYRPDSKFLQAALIVTSWFARRFDRVIEVSRWALVSDSEGVVPPMVRELLAAAAIRTDRLGVAVEAYEKLLAECKNPEAKEWYSRMLGYVEGHRDSCKGALLWDVEGFAWTSWYDRYDRCDSEGKPKSPDQLVDVLRDAFREEVRDSAGRVSLQLLEIKEELARIRSAEEEREHVRETLEKEVSGDLWKTMHDVTRETLVNAGLWISRCVPTHDGDCSPAVAMYQKAVELEVSRRILEPFQRFLQEKGVREWQIGSSPRKTNAITSLDLNKVRDLLQDWQRILKPPKGQRNDDIHDLAFHGVDGFLGEYSDGQKGLVDDLVQLLNWMPSIGRVAKHTDLVSYDRLMELRSRLIGSHPQPGLLIRLVQIFPTRT
jgi:tetratricopeptide (TPR) repeat protein